MQRVPLRRQPYDVADVSVDAIPTLRRNNDSLKRVSGTACHESINDGEEIGHGSGEDIPKGRVVDVATVHGTVTTERLFRAIAYGTVNGILLSPVTVRGANRVPGVPCDNKA